MSEAEACSLSPEEKVARTETLLTITSLSADGTDGLPPPPILTPEEEKRLWRKIDMRLIPIMTLLYLVSYIDRGNIGNAKLQGLLTQLDLNGQRYNIALTMFYLFYCIFNIPANLVLKKFRPSRWIPGMALAWGIAATLTGLVKNYPQLVGVRICLGAAESGLSPGIYYMLSMWYPRHMLQWRFGLFWGGATFSGAFSGLLSYGISFMSGTAGLLGWSWIFIIEGLVTIAAALLAFAGTSVHPDMPTYILTRSRRRVLRQVFVDLPDTATFLTPEERSFVINRLKEDNSSVGEEERFEFRHLTEAIFDWKIIVGSITNISIVSPIYAAALFLPSIINGFGFDPALSQLLTVPPYVVATVNVVLCSLYSDRIKMRSPFVLAGLVLTFIGFAVNVSDACIGAKYLGVHFVVIGAYLSAPIVISWLGNNTVGHYKRGIGIGMQVMVGNFGGLVASNVYHVQDAPRYIHGHIAELVLVGTGLVLVPLTAFVYSRGNNMRDAAQREAQARGMEVEYTVEQLKRMGDRAPDFRYTL
ncbi:MFS general substrate transporter [Trametes cingulata]|nr:MFS general substrate transporter [Trametes cingulata]